MEHGQLGIGRWSILINQGRWVPRNMDILIIEFLQYALQGRVSKILLSEPPRHGKSTLISKNFASYFLTHFPNDNVILSSYTQKLASDFGKDCKNIIKEFGNLSPYNVELAEDSKAVNKFNMKRPFNGRMLATGSHGSILGFGASLFIIDDPIKDVKEARSKTIQESLKEWFFGTAKTRLETRVDGRPPIMIVDAQRLDLNDLQGIIKQNEPVINAKEALLILRNGGSIDPNTWVDINLPAICEDPENDLLGRELGQVLWPEQRDYEWLMAEKAASGSFLFNAIYQGNPTEREGPIFKREWFYNKDNHIHNQLLIKGSELPETINTIRYWDFAASGEAGDATAGFKNSWDGERLIFRNLIHGKLSATTVLRKYKAATLQDGKSTVSIIEQEPGSGGKLLITRFKTEKDLRGHSIRMDKVRESKAERAFDLEALAEDMKIQFDIEGMTMTDIEKACDELIQFTGEDGGEDNIVDTMTGSARYWRNKPVNLSRRRHKT